MFESVLVETSESFLNAEMHRGNTRIIPIREREKAVTFCYLIYIILTYTTASQQNFYAPDVLTKNQFTFELLSITFYTCMLLCENELFPVFDGFYTNN